MNTKRPTQPTVTIRVYVDGTVVEVKEPGRLVSFGEKKGQGK